jgi:hypothetical protein
VLGLQVPGWPIPSLQNHVLLLLQATLCPSLS